MPVIGPGAGASFDSLDWLRARSVGWWESWDLSTVTLSGQSVSRWRDKSPKGRDFTASANQPTLTTSNGVPVLAFDRTASQRMTCAAINLSATGFSVFVLAKTGDATNQYVLSSTAGAASDPALITRFASLGTEWYADRSSRLTSVSSQTAGVWNVSSLVAPATGTMTAFGNGLIGETGSRDGRWLTYTSWFDNLGSANASVNFYGGAVAAIIQIADAVSPDEHAQVVAYLTNAIQIPSGIAASSPPLVFR